jgi:hypothetical protein
MPPAPGRAGFRIVLMVLAAAAAVLAVHVELLVRRPDRQRVTFDSAEYAIAGRTWARTGRLGTTFVLPHESRAPARPPFPLVLGHPLVPALDAIVFRVMGLRSDATLVPSALAYLALVVLVLGLARALGAGLATAVVAAGAVAVSPHILHFAVEGLTELPFAAALVAAMILLAGAGSGTRALTLGTVLGLAHLTRPVMVPMLPVWLAALAATTAPGRRVRDVALAVAAFAPFAVGLALYKLAAAGSPFADVARYNLLIGLDPAWTHERVQCLVDPPAPLPQVFAHLPALAAKLRRALPAMAYALFAQAGPSGAIGGAALAIAAVRGRERALAIATLALGAIMVVLISLTVPSTRYLLPLLPLVIVAAVVAIDRLARALRMPAVTGPVIAALLVALTTGHDLARDWRWAAQRPFRDRGTFTESEWQAAGERLANVLPPGTMMACDAGAILAWYADRPAVLLPGQPADLAVLGARLPVDAVVLTNEWLLERPGFEAWKAVAAAPGTLAGWRHVATVRAGGLRAVVLARVSAVSR